MLKLAKYFFIIMLNIIFICNFQLNSWAALKVQNDYEFKMINNKFFDKNILTNELKETSFNIENENPVLKSVIEIISGYLLSIVSFAAFFFLGTLIGSKLEPEPYTDGDTIASAPRGFGTGLVFSLFGASLGGTTGVYLIGNIGKDTGSFLLTLTGTLIGTIVFTFLIVLTYDTLIKNYPQSLDNHIFQLITFVLSLLIPVGSTIGFNLSKKPKILRSIKENSDKINFTKNGLSYKVLSF